MARGLFEELKASSAGVWRDYTRHPFVEGLKDASLSEAAFKYYLIQDYIFLYHFARAYGLAAFKAHDMQDLRESTAVLTAIVDEETSLHVDYCKGWGLSEQDMLNTPEDPACMAYTRYVLEAGVKGDVLDLHVALSPCVIGYAEIGTRLAQDAGTRRENNPYSSWIDMYSGEDYIAVSDAAVARLDRLFEERGSEARLGELKKTFEEATRLEVDFWQMGLNAVGTQ